jgi:glycosyltransferase involved in cell wall biosynthesis
MRIAFVNQPWDLAVPLVGGYSSISILTYQFARRLARSNEVIIYAKRDRSQQKVECDDEGIRYRRMPVAAEDWLLKPFKLLDRLSGFLNSRYPFFASSLYYPGYALQVARDLRTQQPDIVHIHNFSQFVPLIRAFNPEAKFVLHMNCEWLTQLDQAMIKRRLSKTDLVIGCSEYITNKIRCCFPQFAARCQTVLNGVDVNHFVSENGHSASKQDGVKRLLFVGRISPEKGMHVLLEAFEQVVEHYPQVHLDVVGPIGSVPIKFIVALSDEDRVRDLASLYCGDGYFSHLQAKLSADVTSQVSFPGFVPHSRLVEYYRKADVLINPSLSEAFGMSLVEAMACQVPVVATRVGGMTEIIEQSQAGLLTEPGDATALAQAILRLLTDDDLRKRMGVAGRKEAVTRYSWDQVAKKLLGLYENTCYGNE